jgi:Ras-related protein Rab-4B
MTDDQCDFLFKFIIIGNGNCGKTSLLYHYIHGKCNKLLESRTLEC